MNKFLAATSLIAILALPACGGINTQGGQFWQRTDMTSAIYTQGADAQLKLDKSISECVIELREAQSLGSIQNAIPGDTPSPDADQQALADWDTPDHDGALLAEHSDYHDFEDCMKAKGWERTDYATNEVAKRAEANWYIANKRYGYDPRVETSGKQVVHDYGHLND